MKGTKGFPATLAIAKQTLRRTSLSRETRLQAITDAVSRFASTHLRDKETQEEAIIAIEEVIAEALANNLTLESIKASMGSFKPATLAWDLLATESKIFSASA